MSLDRDRQAYLESLLVQNENEIELLERTLKKVKKDYEENTANLSEKVKEFEKKDAELIELRKSSAHKDYEIEVLRFKNKELEDRIKNILGGEAQKISQTLNWNQKLEQENLKLFRHKIELEEKIREAASQINHYKNMNEAHEKHQELSKKNAEKLEKEVEKLNQELNDLRRKSIVEINAKSEELTRAKFRLEEYKQNAELLTQQLEQKEDLIKAFGTNTILEEIRKKLRIAEASQQSKHKELQEKKNELNSFQDLRQHEIQIHERQIEEYEQIIEDLKKKSEDLREKLAAAELENKKMKFEVEHEREVRETIENFRVPMFHRDRLGELSKKCEEWEEKYRKLADENKALKREVAKLRNEANVKLLEMAKSQRETYNKENLTGVLDKVQQASDKARSTIQENAQLKQDLEIRRGEIRQLKDEIEDFMARIRDLTQENSNLKQALYNYNPRLNLNLVSRQHIDDMKDKEINQLKERLREIKAESEEAIRRSQNQQDREAIKYMSEVFKADLAAKDEIIEGLVRKLEALNQSISQIKVVPADTAMVEEAPKERKKSEGDKDNSDYKKEIKELLQKRYDLEEDNKRLELENQALLDENKELSNKVVDMQVSLRNLENQSREHLMRMNILEKENKIKAEVIANREKHIGELSGELSKLSEDRKLLQAKVNELEQRTGSDQEKIRSYEEHISRINQINFTVVGDKENYLKAILTQKKDIAMMEKKYQEEIERIKNEREELRAQLVDMNNKYNTLMQEHSDAAFSSRLRLENQNIIITTFLKKIAHLEKVIAELEGEVTKYLEASQKDFEKNIPKLSEISNILNRSRLTVEDYKNFEAIKDQLNQQKAQYEETVKFLENTVETLTQKYLALEESYHGEKKGLNEQLEQLKRDNFDIINKYENKLREYEEEKANQDSIIPERAREPAQERQEEQSGMEVEEKPPGAGISAETQAEIDSLKSELDTEKGIRLNLESKLEEEREKTHRAEEERARLLKLTITLENDKANLSKIFTVRETSWVEQKKNYVQQIKAFREDEERKQRLTELMERVDSSQSQEQRGGAQGGDIRYQDLLVQIENLRNDKLLLKKALEEKRKETLMRMGLGQQGEEGQLETEEQGVWKQKFEALEVEYQRVRKELGDMELKLKLVEGVGSGETRRQGMEMMESENELQELRRALDQGSLIEVLERAQNLLMALSQKDVK